jgi:hypothetical protein
MLLRHIVANKSGSLSAAFRFLTYRRAARTETGTAFRIKNLQTPPPLNSFF